ncbi:MAG: endonuclease/exonuclease/phosphatase family protein [Bacteroidales bacterium]|nr:endonuclease/exonuclease/phosphatase family protein [Bacteroidales bacterium]
MIRKILHNLLLIGNIFFALGLLASYLSVYVSPADFWLPAIVGLLYPFLLIINIGYFVYWVFRWRWLFAISLIAIVLGVNHLNAFIQLPFGRAKKVARVDLKVLSYNVNLFKLYSWAKGDPTYGSILNYINKENFDVVCLQEFYVRSDKFTEAQARRMLGMNSHVEYILKRKQSAYGLAIFSKYPIVDTGEILFENSFNSCIYADILVAGDTVRVYNNHLQSLRLKERNFNFLLKSEFRNESNKYNELKDILTRMHNAFEKRAQQVDKIVKHIDGCKYPIILCGDFNDSPVSYTYKELTHRLNDSFKEGGVGFVYTYAGLWPSYRIDYILHSPSFEAVNFYSPRINYSDHYPVVAKYVFRKRRN